MSVVVLEKSELSPELLARIAPIWEAAHEALGADTGTLIDLANLARRQAERDAERPGGRRHVVIQHAPRAEASEEKPSTTKTARRSPFTKTWTKHLARTDEQRARASALLAAQRAEMSDEDREARNRVLTERRRATTAGPASEGTLATWWKFAAGDEVELLAQVAGSSGGGYRNDQSAAPCDLLEAEVPGVALVQVGRDRRSMPARSALCRAADRPGEAGLAEEVEADVE